MDEQEKVRRNFRKIDRQLTTAQVELERGNLDEVVEQCLQVVKTAKHMADDVYFLERNINAICVEDLSHPEISRHIQPVHQILQGLKDKDTDDSYNAIANFMIGAAYLAQKRYQLAARFLRAAVDTFSEISQAYSALEILCEVYARLRYKRLWRETQIKAMLLQPHKDLAFKEYAEGVLRIESDCLGLSNNTLVLKEMRRILEKNKDHSLRAIDKALIKYITSLGPEFRDYPPIYIFHTRVG